MPVLVCISFCGASFQLRVSSASHDEQTGTQSEWMVLHLSQTHWGPRGADNALVNQPRTTSSELPSPRSIAAIIVRARASGSLSTISPNARRASGKSSAARFSSAIIKRDSM